MAYGNFVCSKGCYVGTQLRWQHLLEMQSGSLAGLLPTPIHHCMTWPVPCCLRFAASVSSHFNIVVDNEIKLACWFLLTRNRGTGDRTKLFVSKSAAVVGKKQGNIRQFGEGVAANSLLLIARFPD